MWADARTNSEVSCSAGSYCPTSIEQLPCSDGYSYSVPDTFIFSLWIHKADCYLYNANALVPKFSGITVQRDLLMRSVSSLIDQLNVCSIIIPLFMPLSFEIITIDLYVLNAKYTGCFRLTTCNSKSESQNIHAYGVMLIVSLLCIQELGAFSLVLRISLIILCQQLLFSSASYSK